MTYDFPVSIARMSQNNAAAKLYFSASNRMIHGQIEAMGSCLGGNGLLDYVDGEAMLLGNQTTHLLRIKCSISKSPRWGHDHCRK